MVTKSDEGSDREADGRREWKTVSIIETQKRENNIEMRETNGEREGNKSFKHKIGMKIIVQIGEYRSSLNAQIDFHC